jgi:predicted protein tyrosine phosphatase
MSQWIKIKALPRDLFNQLAKDPEKEAEMIGRCWVISINSSADTGCPLSDQAIASGKVLVMKFDDICSELPGLKLMDEFQANQIVEFVKKIPEKAIILVHCTAGVCRSGAVAEVIDLFLNDDPERFYQENPYILPNAHVKTMLVNAFGICPFKSSVRTENAPYNKIEITDGDIFTVDFSNPF